MKWLSRRRRSTGPDAPKPAQTRAETLGHFREFVTSRIGVEAYIEPATANDPATVVLVARNGEWTRRRVPDPSAARTIARELEIPIYDVNLTGYPRAMREWSAQQPYKRR